MRRKGHLGQVMAGAPEALAADLEEVVVILRPPRIQTRVARRIPIPLCLHLRIHVGRRFARLNKALLYQGYA